MRLIGAFLALGPLIGAPFAHASGESSAGLTTLADEAHVRRELRPLRAVKNHAAILYVESARAVLMPLAKASKRVKKNRSDASHHCGSCGTHPTKN